MRTISIHSLHLAAAFLAITSSPARAEAPKTRNFELTYATTVAAVPDGARRLDLWLPYPTSDEQQAVEVAVVSEAPWKVEKEERFGNSMLHVSREGGDPTTLSIELKVKVVRTELVRRDFERARPKLSQRSPELARWLEADLRGPLNERIRRISREVTQGRKTDAERARAIYDYVVDTMSYDKSGTGWGEGDVDWACDAKRGNCTDFHALFIGLARSAGIPAKFEIGFPIPAERGQGEVGGYHCWAKFYLDGYGWVPVDASEARKHPEKRDYFFGAHDENRVLFTVGRDLELAPRQQGKPLNFFIYPYVEIDGKPVTVGVSKTFSYRDLPPDGGPSIGRTR